MHSFFILQCTVAGPRGLSGASVWGPAGFRASSGRSAAQTTRPCTETAGHAEGFTGKPVGMSSPPLIVSVISRPFTALKDSSTV